MKKRFIFLLLTFVTFAPSLFAEDFVVTEIVGTVKYETSPDVWTKIEKGDKVTNKTIVYVPAGGLLGLKEDNGKVYDIGYINKGSIGEAIKTYNNKIYRTKNNDRLVEVAIMPDSIDERELGFLERYGFNSIKELPSGKNVVRLSSSSRGYEIIELTWTKSSANLVFIEGYISDNMDGIGYDEGIDINERTERVIDKKDVKNITDIIKKINFYNQSGYTYHTGYSTRDSDSWYVEAYVNGKYKSVYRLDPEETFLNDLGNALYNLVKQK